MFRFSPTRHGAAMRLLLAIFLPFTVFFTIGRPIAGIDLPHPATDADRAGYRQRCGRSMR
jgi:hypothetical protein